MEGAELQRGRLPGGFIWVWEWASMQRAAHTLAGVNEPVLVGGYILLSSFVATWFVTFLLFYDVGSMSA